MLPLLCVRTRPEDITEATRLVVAKADGLQLGDRILQRGDEVPAGALSLYALRLEYRLHRLETTEYAAKHDPDLREACARRGVVLDDAAVASRVAALAEVESMSWQELVKVCERFGLPRTGSTKQLRDRLAQSIVA